MLQLTRPLAVVDLETTGLSTASDRIVEISILKVFPDGSRELKTRRLNPEQPIPRQATAVHGISDAHVAQQPAFRQVAKALSAFLDGCDLCTFNGRRFDVPLLAKEFARVQLEFPSAPTHHIDVFDLFRLLQPQLRSRTLTVAVEHYLYRSHSGAHQAAADVSATFEVLHAMLQRHQLDISHSLNSSGAKVTCSVDQLHELCLGTGLSTTRKPSSLIPAAVTANFQPLLAQLLGMCSGILADGEVNEAEAFFFAEWLRRNAPTQPIWPFTDLLARVKRIFADGTCDESERAELRQVMTALLESATYDSLPTEDDERLPLCSPAPHPVEFMGRHFVVTGKFAFGPRQRVFSAILDLGGIPTDTAPSATTHYVVVGAAGSSDWLTSTQGRKLQKAVQLRAKGYPLHIISEEHFRTYLA